MIVMVRFILYAIIAGTVLMPPQQAHAQKKDLSTGQLLHSPLQDILVPLPEITGWADDTHYRQVKPRPDGTPVKVLVNARTGEEQTLTPEDTITEAAVTLKEGEVIYTDTSGNTRKLTQTDAAEKNPVLSPDGEKVAFTRDHDLYVLDIGSGEELRITEDGSDVIYNGWASWVYMEEILGRATNYKAFWWSPDSEHIAFMRFDDTRVPVFPIYQAEGRYGKLQETRYPKSGDPNPEVKIGIASAESGEVSWADFDEKQDQYFGTPYWRPDGQALWVQWMNRGQDRLVIYELDLPGESKQEIYTEEQDTWIQLDDDNRLHFLEDEQGFLLMSDKSGWMHIYHYSVEGKLLGQLTSGEWTVTAIDHTDAKNGWIYFTARKENSTRHDLYRVKLNGGDLQRLTFGDYTHKVLLSPDASYFITIYGNASTPDRMALVRGNGEVVRELGDSKGPHFSEYNLAKTELLRVKIPDGFALPLRVTWPVHLDKTRKYPVLISIYGGPNAGTVYDGWRFDRESQVWASEGLIQVSMDHRGSGHFGKAGQNYLYRNLSHWELADYTEAVKWLLDEYPFIDSSKIMISGFSYGGYMTCMALTKGSDVFTHGIAGGSVTDWHLYDTHYTERFMDTPEENPEGYKSSAVMTYANRYKGMLRIVHGTADDNVHEQNSLQLVSALEDTGRSFEYMPYPGAKHGWRNLPAKWNHFQAENRRFIYQHLLERPVPDFFK